MALEQHPISALPSETIVIDPQDKQDVNYVEKS